MIKTLQKMGIEETYLNIVKAIYNKPTANIIFNSEKPKVFPLRSGTRKRHLLSPLLLHIGISSSEIRLKREIKDIQIGKKKKKLCLQKT